MIGLGWVCAALALMFAGVAAFSLRARRWRSAAFYGLWSLSFSAGDVLGDLGNGALVLGLIGLAVWGLPKGEPAAHLPPPLRRRGGCSRLR